MKSSVYGFSAQAVALAAMLGLGLSGPHRAAAAPPAPINQSDSAPTVTILSPAARASFSGVKPVEISAFYQGSSTNQIVSIELYVDGAKAAQKVLDAPEEKGVVSFLVDSSALTAGRHQIVIRASAADAEVVSAASSFVFDTPAPMQSAIASPSMTSSEGAPTLKIDNPAIDGQVQGKVTLRMQASDPSGKPPYVSLFIDHAFKTLRNYAPYEFTWDTTQYANGYHTIEAFGYNDSQAVGHASPLRVYVNNPGGRTERRTDLLDAPKSSANAKAAHRTTKAIKPILLARRPTGATLAISSPKATQAKRDAKIARAPRFSFNELTLTGMPGLSDPFTAKVARPKSNVPTRGFKPMLHAIHAPNAIMASSAISNVNKVHHLLIAKTPTPRVSFSTKFLTSPTPPTILEFAQPLAAKPLVHTIKVNMPVKHHAQHVAAIHPIHAPQSVNWIRAAGERSIMFNSTKLPLERPLTARGSVMFGPLRQIFQEDGGSLMWQARTGTVIANTSDKIIKLTIGQKTAMVNHTPTALAAAPYINAGRTMVPLSFVQTALDATVQYDPANGHLLITSNK